MSAFILKIIACISMLMDHLGYAIFGELSFFNYIGRIAFPIFAFQITEGYSHTKNLKKYLIRLFLFALISQIPFAMFSSIITNDIGLNVIFTLLLGLIAIIIYDKYKKILGVIAGITLGIIAQYFKMDYGIYGISIVMLFYIFKNNKLSRI